MSYPKALRGSPEIMFFTDFDGTITLKDTNDYMTDHLGFGEKRRRELNLECLEEKVSFRDSFQEMIDSIKAPYSECIKLLLDNIDLDPHFNAFYKWAKANGVPVVVLSSGMTSIIRPLLEKLVGPEANDIDIICNEMVDRDGMNREQPGGWNIKYHDDSDFGHDKSLTIRPYAEHFKEHSNEPRPTMLYAGDGVSDLSAARETDLLFAKKGRGEYVESGIVLRLMGGDLVSYCERQKIPFTLFEDWSYILEKTKEILEGKTSLDSLAKKGLEEVQQAKN